MEEAGRCRMHDLVANIDTLQLVAIGRCMPEAGTTATTIPGAPSPNGDKLGQAMAMYAQGSVTSHDSLTSQWVFLAMSSAPGLHLPSLWDHDPLCRRASGAKGRGGERTGWRL